MDTLPLALEKHIEVLAEGIGERHIWNPRALEAAANHIEASFSEAGHEPLFQSFPVRGHTVRNIEVEIRGISAPSEIVLTGAHYDTVPGSPGADDNASGIASLLALGSLMAARRFARTLRFVAFVNEEPPFYMTGEMGSTVYARRCRERGERIVAMFSLESLGCYSAAPGTQRFPAAPLRWLYPDTGNFIGFVSNLRSLPLLRRSVAAFRRRSGFPSEGLAAPTWLPGVGWSDQWSFWNCGYPGVMITDTAPFRNPNYHTPLDLPRDVNFSALSRLTEGLFGMLSELAGMSD